MVIGGGAWGSSLAAIASHNANDIVVYDRRFCGGSAPEGLTTLRTDLSKYTNIKYTSNLADVSVADLVVIAVPSHACREVLVSCKPHIKNSVTILSASKGIEGTTLFLMTDVIGDVLPDNCNAVISGPTFASELLLELPAAAVVASKDKEVGMNIINTFSTDYFTMIYSNDVIGVQIGGALKNVVAVMAGIAEGLNLGMNARAAIITIGLNEIKAIISALGGDESSITGLACVGDLVLTSSSKTSRNMTFGYLIANGNSPQQIIQKGNGTYEGYNSSFVSYKLCHKLNIQLPLIETLFKILYEGGDPKGCLLNLLDTAVRGSII